MADELQFSSSVRAKLLDLARVQDGRLEGEIKIELKDQISSKRLPLNASGFRFPSPSEIVALRPEAIAKLVPNPGAHDAEETKLVHVDLYDIELPWRYSVKFTATSAPYPWIVVIVGPSEQMTVLGDAIDVAASVLAVHPPSQSHRCAHVQTQNEAKLSRLVSPANLQPNTRYTAAIVGAFNSRGDWAWQDDGQITPLDKPEPIRLYHAWNFTTGAAGDFESLAEQLRVRKTSQVGVVQLKYRDTDQQLQLRGAITRIDAVPAADQPVVDELKSEIRSLAARVEEPPDAAHPAAFPRRELIGLPEYGLPWNKQAALVEQVGTWLETINRDPRFRAIAGMGTWLGIEAQEQLMAAAVEQAGALRSVADRLRKLALGVDLATRHWKRRFPDDPFKRMEIVGPAMARMLSEDGRSSVLARVTNQTLPGGKASTLVAGHFSSAAARLLRNGTARSRHLKNAGKLDRDQLLSSAARMPAKPARAPVGLPHVDLVFDNDNFLNRMPDGAIIDSVEFRGLVAQWTGSPITDDFLEKLTQVLEMLGYKFSLSVKMWLMLHRRDSEQVVSYELLILSLRLTSAVQLSNDVCALLLIGRENMLSKSQAFEVVELLNSVDYPGSVRCVNTKVLAFFRPGVNGIRIEEMFSFVWGCADGEDIEVLVGCSPHVPPDRFVPISIPDLSDVIIRLIDPTAAAAPSKVRVQDGIANYPIGTLASPELPLGLDFSAWQLVRDYAKDWLLPGVSSVPADSIVTLKTNPPFIEAFMVALNAQFMAEARWRNLWIEREFTSLRMFWGQIDQTTGKRSPDIQPITKWLETPIGDLGSPRHHSIAAHAGGGNEDLVILFRTELFRRYPGTVVYLLKASEAEIDTLIRQQPNFGPPVPNPQTTFGPVFMGNISEDVVFFTFHVPPSTLDEYWLVLDEPPAELRFVSLPFSNDLVFDKTSIDRHTRVAIQGRYLMKMGVGA